MAHWAAKGVKCQSLTGLWADDTGAVWNGPAKGEICTVRHVRRFDGDAYISVEGRGHDWFLASAFRPLVKRSQQQDVALFTPLLTQKSIQVSEPERVS